MSAAHAAVDEAPLEPVPSNEAPAILQQIRQELDHHYSSVGSIYIKYTVQKLQGGVNKEKEYPAEHWEWAQQGRQKLLLMHPVEGPRVELQMRHWDSFDGERAYAVFYHRHDASKVNEIRVSNDESESLRHGAHIAFAMGWSITLTPDSLSVLLAKPGAKVIGKRSIGGSLCYELEVEKFSDANLPEKQLLLAWIDPANGWLPRRITVLPERMYTHPEDGEAGVVWNCEVMSFQRWDDPVLRTQHVFPAAARFGDLMPALVTVNEVRLNDPLPGALFRPEIPDGAKVVENYGTSRQRTQVTGGAVGEGAHERNVDADRVLTGINPGPGTRGGGASVDARPSQSSNTSLLVLCLSTGVLLAACVIAWRRRNKSC